MSGRTLYFERHGRGPALVLLHGFMGTGQSMAEVAQSLEQDYETLALDLPGHGHSADVLGTGAYGFDDLFTCLGPHSAIMARALAVQRPAAA